MAGRRDGRPAILIQSDYFPSVIAIPRGLGTRAGSTTRAGSREHDGSGARLSIGTRLVSCDNALDAPEYRRHRVMVIIPHRKMLARRPQQRISFRRGSDRVSLPR